jgi:hypothetical protein
LKNTFDLLNQVILKNMKKVLIAMVLMMAVITVNAQTTNTQAKKVTQSTVTTPAAKPAATQAATPAATTPAAKPAEKPVAKPAAKPAAKPKAKPAAKPTVKKN